MRKGAQLRNHPPSQRLRRGRTPSTRRAGRGSTWSWCRSSEELSKESTPARSVPRSERCNASSRRVPATTRGNAPTGIPRKTHSLFANTPFSSASRSGARCLSTYMGTEMGLLLHAGGELEHCPPKIVGISLRGELQLFLLHENRSGVDHYNQHAPSRVPPIPPMRNNVGFPYLLNALVLSSAKRYLREKERIWFEKTGCIPRADRTAA